MVLCHLTFLASISLSNESEWLKVLLLINILWLVGNCPRTPLNLEKRNNLGNKCWRLNLSGWSIYQTENIRWNKANGNSPKLSLGPFPPFQFTSGSRWGTFAPYMCGATILWAVYALMSYVILPFKWELVWIQLGLI